MRMWMIPPELLCRQHLLGEYRELFTLLGTLKSKRSISGYIANGLIEPRSISVRYFELKKEMIQRGYKPKKPFEYDDSLLSYLNDDEKNKKINKYKSLFDLLNRCENCRKNYYKSLSDLKDAVNA